MATRPPNRPGLAPQATRTPGWKVRRRFFWPRWTRKALLVGGSLAVIVLLVATYFWISFARIIDAKLAGEERPVPRIFGRPFDVRVGIPLTPAQLQQRLNDVGYAERPKPEQPGEFNVTASAVVLVPRSNPPVAKPKAVRVDFANGGGVTRLSTVGGGSVPGGKVSLEAPLLAELAAGERQRKVPLASIPKNVVNAVIAIEDKRFYDHPGVDPIRMVGALVTNVFGNKPYLVGGSTITQQTIKNMILSPEQTYRRKVQEQYMALVLESRLTKDQILELYLNTVTLGQRGPFEIHGMAEGSRVFFGKDLRNVSLSEAATLAGIINAPSRLSPFKNPDRAKERRDIVLREMSGRYVTKADADKALAEPLKVNMRALENEAPYFVDYISQIVDEDFSGVLKKDAVVDVYTTLDLQLQRFAQEAVGDGIASLDKQLKKKTSPPEVALLAVNPKTGEILAFIGGRSYSESQYNRVVAARRQPGSIFKPFVYLAAFERMAVEGRADLTPATIEVDEPTIFKDGDGDYAPTNYQNEYDGPITLRRALASSRNIVAIKVAEAAGYDQVADMWKRVGVGTPPKAVPAIALGVFEVTPLEMATAYTIFTNGGSVHALTGVASVVVNNGKPQKPAAPEVRQIAAAQTTYLVTNMMRSVLNEGTGASARTAGFTFDAAGKTGTTNDLRDAWFAGFTPDLLTIVWVGFDNNQPIGLGGSAAALPIWTSFMKKALAGHADHGFEVPDKIVFADICRESGKLAGAACPRTFHESFLAGTEPHQDCDLHRTGFSGALSKIGNWFKRIIR